MPTYDYKCSECSHQFERVSRIADMYVPLEEPCPSCSKTKTIEKIIAAPLIGDAVRLGVTKTDGKLKERLQEISRNYPGNNINIR